ncbi:MAG: DUF4280 domain-containing protein [Candidatus Spyradocola sp.]|jgi:hypothetical protein
MAFPVAMGATCQCTFGIAPCVLSMTSQQQTISGSLPLAVISDTMLPTFGMCTSLLNPAVAATVTPFGTYVPQPCSPVIVGTWVTGSPTVLIGGKPALNSTSQLTCAYGGMIRILTPGVFTVQVP